MDNKNIADLTRRISQIDRTNSERTAPLTPREPGPHVVRDTNGEKVELDDRDR